MKIAMRVFLATLLMGAFMTMSIAQVPVPDAIRALVDKGEFTKAQEATKAMLGDKQQALDPQMRRRLEYEIERLDRIRKDFLLTPEKFLEDLKSEIPDVTMSDLQRWEQDRSIDFRIIDGKELYFNRSKVNLYRFSKEAKRRRIAEPKDKERARSENAMLAHMAAVADTATSTGMRYVLPEPLHVTMTISVPAGNVPAGETIRCWMPYPRECPTQKNIRFLRSDPEKVHIAPPEHLQRSVCMEKKAEKDKPTVFEIEYEYTSYASYVNVDPAKIKPYDTKSEVYKVNTAERAPHLVFTPRLKTLASEIVGDETNPYLKAKKIFLWITENITYASAIEYSTIENISAYCEENRYGDCGIQGMLFIVLCRISGVPARWQSGWSAEPGRAGMHDWCEFYVEPYGWLHADPSRGLMDSKDERVRMFLFGNFDRYRLIANNDFSVEFDPPKTHFRSEPVDFQRGEVEWRGGNLYFDQWDYKMNVQRVEK